MNMPQPAGLLILAASFGIGSVAAASNPNVIIVANMEGSLMTASRDGNLLVGSSIYLQQSGGGGGIPVPPIFAPINAWRRSTGEVSILEWSMSAVARCANADGSMIGGVDYDRRGFSPAGAIVWMPGSSGESGSHRYLPVPGGVLSRDGDLVNWLSRDGSLGFGCTAGASLTRWTGLTGDNPVAQWLLRDGSTSTSNPWVNVIYCTDPQSSDDGSVVAGSDVEAGPFLWRPGPGGGYVPLPIVVGWQWTSMRAMTPDGRTVVGTAFSEGNQSRLVRWSINPIDGSAEAIALTDSYAPYLYESGHIVGTLYGITAGMSDDGTIIGFNATTETSITPMLWLASGALGTPSPTGVGRLVPLLDYLTAHGVSMSGIDESLDGTLRPAELGTVSADGRTFAGHGYIVKADFEGNPYDAEVIWTARIPIRCGPADIAGLGGTPDWDGQLTPDDLIIYLSSYFAGDLASADLTDAGGAGPADGTLSPDDLVMFLTRFFAGCT